MEPRSQRVTLTFADNIGIGIGADLGISDVVIPSKVAQKNSNFWLI